MELLKSLGINETLWIQLACFIVAYLSFSLLVLKPYMKALVEREKRTIGSEESAVRIIDQVNEMHADYEKKARAIHADIKSQFDQSRTEAMHEYDRIVNEARAESARLLEDARVKIERELAGARKILSSEAPAISAAIASKLMGKEVVL